MSAKIIEFFQGEEKTLSMPRLLTFLAFWPASYVMVSIRTTEALSVYLAAYVAQYGAGRYFSGKGKENADTRPTKKL